MRSILLLIFLTGSLVSQAQNFYYVETGANYSKLRYGKSAGLYDQKDIFTTAPLFLGVGFFSKPEGILCWNLEMNYTRRYISGYSYSGGLGGGTRYSGEAKADIIYGGFFTGFEWGKLNKWRLGLGIQMGKLVYSTARYSTYSWTVNSPSTFSSIDGSGDALFHPVFLKPAIQIGYDFRIGEKYALGIHYRLANDITGFGEGFAQVSAWDNSLILRWMMKKPFKKSKS